MRDITQLLEALDALLRREIAAYEELLQLQQAEKRYAVEQALEPFLANLQAKEHLTHAIAGLEKQRCTVSAQLASQLQVSAPVITLQQLSTRVEAPYAQRFQDYRTRLLVLVTQLQRCNLENEIFLRDSRAFIDGTLAFIARLLPDNLTYHQSGTFTPPTQGRLLSGRI